ncbi:MAG: hypothetical protein LBL59_08345 [Xanthomonadaceae bacterium]|jgi:triacylglycerol lipase|nr:hypothetical protein [Xanthomonadaceae bacterium]
MKLFRCLILVFLFCMTCPLNACAGRNGYIQTRYPIVPAHGVPGWDSLLDIYVHWSLGGPELRADGAEVYSANVSQANPTAVRGKQLIRELDTLRTLHGTQKFNFTSRYVASARPDLAASVIGIGSPNFGSRVFDKLLEPRNATAQKFTSHLTQAISHVIALLSGKPANPQDAVQSMVSDSAWESIESNRQHPRGVSQTCRDNEPEIANGCSSHWGPALRDDYPRKHMDEVNQTLGLRKPFTPRPPSVHRGHANQLKNLGL